MHVKPVVGSVVGPISVTHWAQTLQLPTAYGVVEVAYPDGGARAAGIHILRTLSQQLADGPVSLKALSRIVADTMGDGVRTILIVVPVGNILYIVLRGTGDVYCKRGGEFARLLSGAGEVSGEVKIGDTLLLTSAEFSKAIRQNELTQIFDHLPPAQVAERLTLLLHEKEYGEGSAALILQINDLNDVEIPDTRVHVTPRFHPKNATALLTLVLIAVFGVSVLLGVWKQGTRVKNQSVVNALSDAQHALDEGMALATLNPVKGRERLASAKELLEPLRTTVSARSEEGIRVANLYRQVTDNLIQAMQIHTVKPELFFDAGLVKKDGKISFIGFEGATMGIADQATKTVYALDVTSKNTQVLGGAQAYAGLSYVSIHGTNVYVLTDGGVNQVRLTDKQTTANVVKKDPQWGSIGALVSFGGNLYLLDTQKNRIWKYVATDAGFSETREYLNPDTLPDFGRAASMAIDGSVWIGTADGKIMKFIQGKTDTFTPQGVDPAFGENLTVYTSDTMTNLYVLDSQNKRVVVLNKDGMYLSQYVWQETVTPTQLAVSEDRKKIYLLAAGQLYAVNLK
jgi:DNA-binding beta-propeller fold protein YncE